MRQRQKIEASFEFVASLETQSSEEPAASALSKHIFRVSVKTWFGQLNCRLKNELSRIVPATAGLVNPRSGHRKKKKQSSDLSVLTLCSA